jgi:exonuclease III
MNPSKIVSWNVRGLNSKARQDTVHNLINSFKANVVCIQETKMAKISLHTILTAVGSNFVHKLDLPSVGSSGGFLWPGVMRLVQPAQLGWIIIA